MTKGNLKMDNGLLSKRLIKIAKYRDGDDRRRPLEIVYWDALEKMLCDTWCGFVWATFRRAETLETAESVAADAYGRDFPKTFRLTNRKQNAGGQ